MHIFYEKGRERKHNMTQNKSSCTVGVDGITCVISGCGNMVSCETCLPSEDNYFLKLTPKGQNTEIAIILPKTIRIDNMIGFRTVDIKMLDDVIQAITEQLKPYSKDYTDCCVQQLEVALTVDLGSVDDITINNLMNLFSDALLVNQKKTEGKNKYSCKPQQQFVCGEQFKTDYYFIKKKVTKSFITDTWSNKRLKFKCYSKSAGSIFGGDTSVFRLEILYNERGMRHILNINPNQDNILLKDVLKERSIKALIKSFKQDYRTILVPRLLGYLNETERYIFERLHTMSAYNTLLSCIHFIPDITVYRKALHRYYIEQGKKENAFRKMFATVVKKLKEDEEIEISDRTIKVLQLIGKETK